MSIPGFDQVPADWTLGPVTEKMRVDREAYNAAMVSRATGPQSSGMTYAEWADDEVMRHYRPLDGVHLADLRDGGTKV